MGLREQILAKEDHCRKELSVPEWGLTLNLRTWSARERVRIQSWLKDGVEKHPHLLARVVALSVVDNDGAFVFTDKDVDRLSEKNGKVLEAIAKEAVEWNALGKEEEAKN